MDYNAKIICRKCKTPLNPNTELAHCPHCGADLTKAKAVVYRKPETLEELFDFVDRNEIPVDDLHIYLCENEKDDPKAFGIYRTKKGEYIVYKNKPKGERQFKYRGPDEAFAVNVMYMKLRENVDFRSRPKDKNTSKSEKRQKQIRMYRAAVAAIIVIVAAMLVNNGIQKVQVRQFGPTGYYTINGTTYYHVKKSEWYVFDKNQYHWIESTDPFQTRFGSNDSVNRTDYFISETYKDEYRDIYDFSDRERYEAIYEERRQQALAEERQAEAEAEAQRQLEEEQAAAEQAEQERLAEAREASEHKADMGTNIALRDSTSGS